MLEARKTPLRIASLSLLLGYGSIAVAGGGHGRQAALGGATVGSPVVVLGSAPAGGHFWHKWQTVGVAQGATAPPLGMAFTTVAPNSGTIGSTTAPPLGVALGQTVTLGNQVQTLGAGTITYTYPTVTYAASGTSGSTAPPLGAGQSSNPEVQLGQALGGERLQRIKDRVRELLFDQQSNGQQPTRRKLISLLTDGAMEFARRELRLDLVNWLPVVTDLVTNLVDEEGGTPSPDPKKSPTKETSSITSNGGTITIRAGDNVVISVKGDVSITTDGGGQTVIDQSGTTPRERPVEGDQIDADTGPLLPGENNGG